MSQSPAEPLWTRAFSIAVVINMLMAMVFYLLLTSMAGYAVQRFAAHDSLAGLASSSFIIGAVIGRLVAARFLDTVGRRRILIGAMALLTVAGLAYIPVGALWLIITLRIVHGIAFGTGNTALVVSVQSVIPRARRGEGNGFFSVASTLSTAVGPFLALKIAEHFSFEMLFGVAALCGALALLAALAFRVAEPHGRSRRGLGSLIDIDGLKIGTVLFIAGIAYVPVLSFLALYAADIGAPESASGFFVVFAFSALISRPLAGRIQDRFGDNIVALPAFAAFTIGMALMAAAGSGAMIIASGLFVGAGFASLLSVLLAALVNKVALSQVAVATATFYLLLDGGSGVGPLVLGLVTGALGYAGMFWISTGLTLVAAACYLLVHGAEGARRTVHPA